MQTITIAIDIWKLPIFCQHLRTAGYEFDYVAMDGYMLMKVKAKSKDELEPIVLAASKECMEKRK